MFGLLALCVWFVGYDCDGYSCSGNSGLCGAFWLLVLAAAKESANRPASPITVGSKTPAISSSVALCTRSLVPNRSWSRGRWADCAGN